MWRNRKLGHRTIPGSSGDAEVVVDPRQSVFAHLLEVQRAVTRIALPETTLFSRLPPDLCGQTSELLKEASGDGGIH